MTSDPSSHRRGLAVAVAAMLGVGIAGLQSPALARAGDAVTRSATEIIVPAPLAQRGSTPDGAIVVADNQDNGNWDGKKGDGKGDGKGQSQGQGNWNGNKSGNWNGNGNKSGNWNGNGNKSGNWNGNNGNWNKNGNKYGNNKNWNQYGNKNWSNNNHYNNNWNRNWNNRAYVRGWSRRPYYGEFFGGIVLGSILAANGVGIVPYAPDPSLCWYWADPYMYRGYWDYCY